MENSHEILLNCPPNPYRVDALMATGRSDYPNQVNNVLGIPYIFRGAFDARAGAIIQPMMIAAARALAELAREPVSQEVLDAYKLTNLEFGRDYILPKPFDPRLAARVPKAVAEAAKAPLSAKSASRETEKRQKPSPTIYPDNQAPARGGLGVSGGMGADGFSGASVPGLMVKPVASGARSPWRPG